MNIELVDQIKSFIEGAPPKFVGLRDDGAFGLARVQASAVKLEGRVIDLPKPLWASDVVNLARGVVAGVPRAITGPETVQMLALGVLAIAAQLGRVTMQAETLAAALDDKGDAA